MKGLEACPWAHPHRGKASVLAGKAGEGGYRQRGPDAGEPGVPPFPLSDSQDGWPDPERAGSKVRWS